MKYVLPQIVCCMALWLGVDGFEVPDTPIAKQANLLSPLYDSYQADAIGFFESTKSVYSFRNDTTEELNKSNMIIPPILVSILAAKGMDATTALKSALEQNGASVTACSLYSCSCWLPLSELPKFEALPEVRAFTPVLVRRSQAGSVVNEAVQALFVDKIRDQLDSSINGEGIAVGVLSDSFNRDLLATTDFVQDVASGDIPVDVLILDDSAGTLDLIDEGRAMMQLIHDIAPKAKLLFRTAFNGPEDFAIGIGELADAGADIIVDDIAYFDEPFFQDGGIAQAATNVAEQRGVPYFAAAGNSGSSSFESSFTQSGETVLIDDLPCILHEFSDINIVLVVQTNIPTTLVLQWDEPFASVNNGPGSASDLDFLAFDLVTGAVISASATPNIGGDPVEILELPPGMHGLSVCLFEGPPPTLFKFIDFNDAILLSSLPLDTSTAVGHRNAAAAASVGAVDFRNIDPPILESFSSRGGTPILFDQNGSRQSAEVRNQPRFSAVDGVSTTFFPPGGFFFGTSAAAPNAAAVAALLLQVDNSLSPEEVYNVLGSTAVDMLGPGFDFDSGEGLIDAFAAVDSIFIPVEEEEEPNECFGSDIPLLGIFFQLICLIIGLFG